MSAGSGASTIRWDPGVSTGWDPGVLEVASALGVEGISDLIDAGLNPAGKRRTAAEVARFRIELYEILKAQRPMTVRQVFYQMVARGLAKTENQYRRVQAELVRMRRGTAKPRVPFGWVQDGTRWMRKPNSYGGLRELLEESIDIYRRDIWRAADAYVEVWVEKDALAGVIYQVTAQWDVPLMVTRGFSSVSFLWNAAATIAAQEKPAHVYLFTDHDRSGRLIAERIEADLQEFAPAADIRCTRASVTQEQIVEYDLPTRPPKRSGDPPAVDLDAIPPADLRGIVRRCIEGHVDPDLLQRTRAAEATERESLRDLLDGWAA